MALACDFLVGMLWLATAAYGCPADWPGVPRRGNPWHADRTVDETAQVSHVYACPCCGHRVLDAAPGSYEICPICFWEDDEVQFRWPASPVGANRVAPTAPACNGRPRQTGPSPSTRWALTELGARSPVVPSLTARLRAEAGDSSPGWPSAQFAAIINDLDDHTQVILYSQFWRVDAGRTYCVSGPGLDWQLDWSAPWEHLVEEARAWSLWKPPKHPSARTSFFPHLDRPYRPAPGEVAPRSSSAPRRSATATWSSAT